MSDTPVLPEPTTVTDAPMGLRVSADALRARESITARHIAMSLLVMLALTFIANVITLTVLTMWNRLDAVAAFERMFAIWTPLISGLVGSAVTFYLTKERRS